ncbi:MULTISPECIES: aminoacyl-tRNA deacylase [Vibrio]|uniref:YbaK/aminoacyl-tRNA synthetase-associated domain-containing protein n=2 Tax=Vibrio TaxID=662 RepID=A0A7X4LIQ5_9VIBR|nr:MULTISPECIES: YbaK/EbsC family protein [Vibrio]MBF9001642.1 YbaK/EbsC family protein [Vibrio nitrifigilis]MZI92495.1 hypothetical protein [Vibrio eleionomae]
MNNPEFKTKITQYLDQQQVKYRLLPHQSPAKTVEDAAKQRGIQTEQMVKCILLRDMSNRYALACTAGNTSVDPKKVRAILGWRRMTCAEIDKVEPITGYIIGTVTPINLKTEMPILFDKSILTQNDVTISSGSKMAGICLKRVDLENLVKPLISNIQRDPKPTM